MTEAALRNLDHVVIVVRDLEQASDRYQRLLGRRPSWRGEHPQLGTANTLFRLDNTYLELLSPAGEGSLAPLLRQRLDGDGEGLFALAFGTSDADAWAMALRERGIEVAGPADGEGRESANSAVRRWRNVFLPPEATRGVRLFAIEHLTPDDALPGAALLVKADAAVSGLDHVVVMSGDAEASKALYERHLGLRLALDRSFEHRGLRLLFFRIGGITVEISAPLGSVADSTSEDRLWGMAYRVRDVAGARSRLAARGFEVSEVRQGHKPGTLVCTVHEETHGVATLLIGPDGEDEDRGRVIVVGGGSSPRSR